MSSSTDINPRRSEAEEDMTAPRGVIDHLGYPHLIDKILNHADAETLLAFRRTAKAYEDRCLQIVSQHLVIKSTWKSALDLSSGRGTVNRFGGRWRRYGVTYLDLCNRVSRSGHFFKHCRTLDFNGRSGPKWPRDITDSIHGLENLRIITSPDNYPKHNLNYYTVPTWIFTEEVPDLVVLHFCHFKASSLAVTLSSLFASIAYILAHSGSTTVWIVDLDQVDYSNLPAAKRCEAIQGWQDNLAEELGPSNARVAFLTRKEYVAEYGAEQYRIETCKKLWESQDEQHSAGRYYS
ncbi:hypothetical protein CspHIS471_0411340 [Cutaneotrichosporon sp. HIS471]|nr:hypothetical protein CspHIS471_0411340 [Cutaneotrichosporon sp. HIS471]